MELNEHKFEIQLELDILNLLLSIVYKWSSTVYCSTTVIDHQLIKQINKQYTANS